MAPHGLDGGGAADDDAGLRAAQQLVAAKREEVGADLDPVTKRGLVGEERYVGQGTAAEVGDQKEPRARANSASSAGSGSAVNPTTR